MMMMMMMMMISTNASSQIRTLAVVKYFKSINFCSTTVVRSPTHLFSVFLSATK